MQPLDLLTALPDSVLVVDTEARLVWANRTAEDVFGWRLDELRGEPVDFLCHPDDLATALASLASVQEKEVGSVVEVRVRDRAGTYRTYEVRGRDASGVDGVGGVVLVLRDTTDRARWEVAAGDAELYRAVLDHAPGITMVLDGHGRLRGASRALTAIVGRDLERSLGRHLRDLVSDADALTVEAELALATSEPGQRSFEAAFTTSDGRGSVPMSLTVVNLLDDRVVEGLVVTAVDITALAESRARLQHLASHDPLTDLPNRSALTRRVREALAAAGARRSRVGLVYCDIDGFKGVNDRFGHLAGDAVLRQVADRLLSVTRAANTVARMGGDEFVVLVQDGDDRAVRAVLRRIDDALADPVVLPSGDVLVVRMTLGAATADASTDLDDLLGRADTAMYAAKRGRAEPA